MCNQSQAWNTTNLLLVLDGLTHQDALDALLHGIFLGPLDVLLLWWRQLRGCKGLYITLGTRPLHHWPILIQLWPGLHHNWSCCNSKTKQKDKHGKLYYTPESDIASKAQNRTERSHITSLTKSSSSTAWFTFSLDILAVVCPVILWLEFHTVHIY